MKNLVNFVDRRLSTKSAGISKKRQGTKKPIINLESEEQIQFIGFIPSAEFRRRVYLELSDILDQVPGDSWHKLIIMKKRGKFTAELMISSFAKKFYAQIAHGDKEQLLNHLLANIQRQIIAWRRSRFRSKHRLSS